MPLKGRVALVTGASRGIGRAIALGLAADGADVAVNFRREAEEAERTVSEIKKLGRRAAAFGASVESYDEVTAMAARVQKELGPVSILVNNAGIASRGQPVADTDPTEITQLLGVHALGSFNASKAFLPQMREQKRGDIIMISSVATMKHSANGAPYNMAKAAIEALAFTLSKEEMRNGIFVNIVAPPLTETDMGTRLAKAVAKVKDIHELDAQMPFGHVCQPEEVAAVVRYLVSPQNTYVSGEKVSLHGASDRPGLS